MKHVAFMAVLVGGCLPADDRPEPGSVYVTAEPSPSTHGFSTADGWSVSFERVLTAVGDVRVDAAEGGGGCTEYNETHYQWLVDFTVAGREKVALLYALGSCSIEFSFRPPSDDDTLLGPGASASDIATMRVRANDPYAFDERIAVVIRGQAVRAGVIKRFDWAFRHRYELTDCPADSGFGFVSDVAVARGDALELHIVMKPEELFRETPDDDAPLHFDRFAIADVDGDGLVTLLELGDVGAPPDPNEAASSTEDPPSMADLVYGRLLPRFARFEGGGPCEAELDSDNTPY